MITIGNKKLTHKQQTIILLTGFFLFLMLLSWNNIFSIYDIASLGIVVIFVLPIILFYYKLI